MTPTESGYYWIKAHRKGESPVITDNGDLQAVCWYDVTTGMVSVVGTLERVQYDPGVYTILGQVPTFASYTQLMGRSGVRKD